MSEGAKTWLVTGGSGYFGSVLVRLLRERGERVRVLDLSESDERPPEVELIQGDVRDPALVARAVEGADVVLHNVAQVPLAKDRHQFWSVNQGGTETLLAAAKQAGVGKLVYTSSSAIYGAPARNPVDEETPPTPAEDYGRAKLEGERACRRYAEQGLDVSIVRPRTILGHGRLGIFQILFEWVRRGKNLPVLGRGDNRYQFVHSDDLADAILRAAERPGARSYNVGAAEFGTMRETLEALCRHAGTGSLVRSLPQRPVELGARLATRLGLVPLGPYHALMYGRSLWFDLSRTSEELGWEPRWSNAEMIVQSYEWYLANREAVLSGAGASHHTRGIARLGLLKVLPWLL
ncbi:MAG TPA: hypothetical protein DEA08_23090 [Planctomycetes bacterium]|nr:hypothetical protein [Planctomycetota bacterium]